MAFVHCGEERTAVRPLRKTRWSFLENTRQNPSSPTSGWTCTSPGHGIGKRGRSTRARGGGVRGDREAEASRSPLRNGESKRTTRAQWGIIRPLRRKSCHLMHFEDLVPTKQASTAVLTRGLSGVVRAWEEAKELPVGSDFQSGEARASQDLLPKPQEQYRADSAGGSDRPSSLLPLPLPCQPPFLQDGPDLLWEIQSTDKVQEGRPGPEQDGFWRPEAALSSARPRTSGGGRRAPPGPAG